MFAVHHFYHIYADGSWRAAVEDHVRALLVSGLAAAPNFSLFVGIVGNAENADAVRAFLTSKQCAWQEAACAPTGWEQLTLQALAAHSQMEEGLAFYAHTKGAHDPNPFNIAWRSRMTHFNVIKWRDAVTALQTHDAYGCHWMNLEGNWLFGGNFWWTHLHLLRQLAPPRVESRWQAEEWIGQLAGRAEGFKVCDPAPPFPGTIKAK